VRSRGKEEKGLHKAVSTGSADTVIMDRGRGRNGFVYQVTSGS
jgi:hypothetical protein